MIRGLTPGETALVASVFGSAVDPAGVTIRHQKFWALQPWWVTMAPDGHIWCHPNGDSWCTDYAAQGPAMREHFIHEMTHVWQVQHGRNLIFARPPFARYTYELSAEKPFSRYGIEQQACIVADAYRLREAGALADLAAYAAVLPFGDWRVRKSES